MSLERQAARPAPSSTFLAPRGDGGPRVPFLRDLGVVDRAQGYDAPEVLMYGCPLALALAIFAGCVDPDPPGKHRPDTDADADSDTDSDAVAVGAQGNDGAREVGKE